MKRHDDRSWMERINPWCPYRSFPPSCCMQSRCSCLRLTIGRITLCLISASCSRTACCPTQATGARSTLSSARYSALTTGFSPPSTMCSCTRPTWAAPCSCTGWPRCLASTPLRATSRRCFFFISPAALGTVLGIDALNQAYSQFWGLLGLKAYLGGCGRRNRAAWLACVCVATLSKENGIMFFFIPPRLLYGFGRAGSGRLRRDLLYGLAASAAYFCVRLALTNSHVDVLDDYFESTLSSKLSDIGTFIGMTWIPLDYVCLVHPPSRNLWVLALTLALPMPFILTLFIRGRRLLLGRPFLALRAACALLRCPTCSRSSRPCTHIRALPCRPSSWHTSPTSTVTTAASACFSPCLWLHARLLTGTIGKSPTSRASWGSAWAARL